MGKHLVQRQPLTTFREEGGQAAKLGEHIIKLARDGRELRVRLEDDGKGEVWLVDPLAGLRCDCERRGAQPHCLGVDRFEKAQKRVAKGGGDVEPRGAVIGLRRDEVGAAAVLILRNHLGTCRRHQLLSR